MKLIRTINATQGQQIPICNGRFTHFMFITDDCATDLIDTPATNSIELVHCGKRLQAVQLNQLVDLDQILFRQPVYNFLCNVLSHGLVLPQTLDFNKMLNALPVDAVSLPAYFNYTPGNISAGNIAIYGVEGQADWRYSLQITRDDITGSGRIPENMPQNTIGLYVLGRDVSDRFEVERDGSPFENALVSEEILHTSGMMTTPSCKGLSGGGSIEPNTWFYIDLIPTRFDAEIPNAVKAIVNHAAAGTTIIYALAIIQPYAGDGRPGVAAPDIPRPF